MIAEEQVKTDFFAFGGGLNLVQPALAVPQGSLLDVQNYEPAIAGGYTRCGGYERIDGQTAPSGVVLTGVAGTFSSTPSIGALVVCGAASGLFVKVITGGIIVASATGTFPSSTNITVGGSSIGTSGISQPLAIITTPSGDAQNALDGGNVLRNLIQPAPGSGPVRGIWLIGLTVYAFRDNIGGTAGAIYASSASGWVAVPLYSELKYTVGQAALATISEGTVLYGATSGATGTLKRLVRESGVHTSNNSVGRFIIAPLTGTFTASELVKTGSIAGPTIATGAGPATAITIATGGKYNFVNYNFTGKTGTIRTYGASGTNRCFEFDGLVYVPINTGATIDTPAFITAVNNYLHVGLRSSLTIGSLGNPYGFQVSEGATEIAVGDDITGLQQMRGSALAIFTRNTTQQLVGASTSTWVKSYVSIDTGAVANTVQTIGDTFALDDRGVTQMQATFNYGNFALSTVSRFVQPLVDAIRGKAIASCVVRQRDQMRVFCTDGTVLIMYQDSTTQFAANSGQISLKTFTKLKYPITVSTACSLEDSSGTERIFMGDSLGYVYEINKGSSFDGAAIEAFCRVWYINNGSPRARKRYRKAIIEMTTVFYSPFKVTAEFSYGDSTVAVAGDTSTTLGAGGYWDFNSWDAFNWDNQTISQPQIRIDGTGINMSLFFYSNTALDLGHTLQGAIVHFSQRRQER